MLAVYLSRYNIFFCAILRVVNYSCNCLLEVSILEVMPSKADQNKQVFFKTNFNRHFFVTNNEYRSFVGGGGSGVHDIRSDNVRFYLDLIVSTNII